MPVIILRKAKSAEQVAEIVEETIREVYPLGAVQFFHNLQKRE